MLPQPVQNFAVSSFCLPHLIQKDIRNKIAYCCFDLLFKTRTKTITAVATGNTMSNNSLVPNTPKRVKFCIVIFHCYCLFILLAIVPALLRAAWFAFCAATTAQIIQMICVKISPRPAVVTITMILIKIINMPPVTLA